MLTTPLLVGLDGTQEDVEVAAATTSGITEPPAEQFGKLMSIPDDVLPMYFRYATAWPPEQVDDSDRTSRLRGAAPERGEAAARRARSSTCTTAPAPGVAAEAEFDRVFKEQADAGRHPRVRSCRPASCCPTALLESWSRRRPKREARPARSRSRAASASTTSRQTADRRCRARSTCVQVGKRRWARVRRRVRLWTV